MVAELAQAPGSRHPRADRLLPAGDRRGLRGLARRGRRRSGSSATGASCTRRPTRCRGARRSGPTCGGSGRAGLPFDMCFLARQLPIALELARACPDTRLVLDHCGVPDIAGGGFDAWRDGMPALAAMPNVVAKLSGVLRLLRAGRRRRSPTVRPYVEHVIAAFGPERCLWGSDWPVVNLRARPAGLDRGVPDDPRRLLGGRAGGDGAWHGGAGLRRSACRPDRPSRRRRVGRAAARCAFRSAQSSARDRGFQHAEVAADLVGALAAGDRPRRRTGGRAGTAARRRSAARRGCGRPPRCGRRGRGSPAGRARSCRRRPGRRRWRGCRSCRGRRGRCRCRAPRRAAGRSRAPPARAGCSGRRAGRGRSRRARRASWQTCHSLMPPPKARITPSSRSRDQRVVAGGHELVDAAVGLGPGCRG